MKNKHKIFTLITWYIKFQDKREPYIYNLHLVGKNMRPLAVIEKHCPRRF